MKYNLILPSFISTELRKNASFEYKLLKLKSGYEKIINLNNIPKTSFYTDEIILNHEQQSLLSIFFQLTKGCSSTFLMIDPYDYEIKDGRIIKNGDNYKVSKSYNMKNISYSEEYQYFSNNLQIHDNKGDIVDKEIAYLQDNKIFFTEDKFKNDTFTANGYFFKLARFDMTSLNIYTNNHGETVVKDIQIKLIN